jgi:hypothetical protein
MVEKTTWLNVSMAYVLAFPYRGWGNPWKPSARIADSVVQTGA